MYLGIFPGRKGQEINMFMLIISIVCLILFIVIVIFSMIMIAHRADEQADYIYKNEIQKK